MDEDLDKIVIGFDKQEIVDVSEKIDTYETSIQPFVLTRPLPLPLRA